MLQRALREQPSTLLELAGNGYHVRRKPPTYPPRFLPPNSFDVANDDGLSFWDQRTIYVEPHLRNLCQTPARAAHWLKAHGQLNAKWLPVQAVHQLHNSCAFIVLSGNVMHEDAWAKWRATDKPDNWNIMTKVEHTKRTAEYVALLEKQNPNGMRKVKVDEAALPAVARPASLAMDVEVVSGYTDATGQPKAKRKRNRKKGAKFAAYNDNAETTEVVAADVVEDNERSSKRRA